jgi:hypothetical protein
MSQLTVGKDVLSYCTKCKLNLSHTIVAMKDTKHIAKVKCNTCGTMHAYKDPSQSTATKTRTRKTTATPSKVVSVADLWMEGMSNTQKKSQAYTIKGSFNVGDIIDHSKFGPGIVQRVVDDKIEVSFRHEIKLLIHQK